MSGSEALDDLHDLLETQGATEFAADLAVGTIRWVNTAGETVARARCEAMLAWNSKSETWCAARELAELSETPIACVAASALSRRSGTGTRAEAEREARSVAKRSGAPFVYAAPLSGGCMFLAVSDVDVS